MTYTKRAFINPPVLSVEADRLNPHAEVRVVIGYFDENGIADPDSKLVHHIVCLYLQRNGKWQCNAASGDPDAAHAPHPIWDGLLSARQRTKVLADLAHAEETYGIRTHALVEYGYENDDVTRGKITSVGAKTIRYVETAGKYVRTEATYPLAIAGNTVALPEDMTDVPKDVIGQLKALVTDHINSRGFLSRP